MTGRSRSAEINRPRPVKIPGAIDQIATAMKSNTSNTHRNQDCPDGHGPIVSVCHQK